VSFITAPPLKITALGNTGVNPAISLAITSVAEELMPYCVYSDESIY
jgi:hypothetical protein